MTIVYPYNDLAGWDFNELRYSIRSMVKYANATRCIVVGFKPPWYTGEHIPMSDTTFKEHSIYSKLLEACKHTDRFIFCNDDHFMLREDLIDYYYSKPLKGLGDVDSYGRKIAATEALFPNGKFFDIHCPMIIESECMPLPYEWLPHEYIVKSLYCNHHNIEGVYMQDCKIPGYMSDNDIMRYTADRSFVSLGPQALGEPMKRYLTTKFPDPSPWEDTA
jgi:hypothetical protein